MQIVPNLQQQEAKFLFLFLQEKVCLKNQLGLYNKHWGTMRWSYICDNGDAQVGHVGDDLTVLWRNLGVLDQFVQVLLCNAWEHTQVIQM